MKRSSSASVEAADAARGIIDATAVHTRAAEIARRLGNPQPHEALAIALWNSNIAIAFSWPGVRNPHPPRSSRSGSIERMSSRRNRQNFNGTPCRKHYSPGKRLPPRFNMTTSAVAVSTAVQNERRKDHCTPLHPTSDNLTITGHVRPGPHIAEAAGPAAFAANFDGRDRELAGSHWLLWLLLGNYRERCTFKICIAGCQPAAMEMTDAIILPASDRGINELVRAEV